MRVLVLARLVVLAGCIIDNDPVRVENFAAETPMTFTYDAWTNTVMTANDDGAAEQIRRNWLVEALTDHGMCAAGYVVETRQFVQPWEGPFGNGGDIVGEKGFFPTPEVTQTSARVIGEPGTS
jgi:hypothetical protein